MKNLTRILFAACILVAFSQQLGSTPSLEWNEDVCGGYVVVVNQSDCTQTVYCHEISTTNLTYNMGQVAPGGSLTVYPTASQARIWSETAGGTETTSTMSNCVNNYNSYIDHCDGTNSNHCTINVTNNACRTIRIYAIVAGQWKIVKYIERGATATYHPVQDEALVFAYTFDEVIGTVTANCGSSYTVNDSDCDASCVIHLTNSACAALKLYVRDGSDWNFITTINQGSTYDHSTENGTNYLFKYADGTVVDTWTGWCGESHTVTDQCSNACTIYLKNEACHPVRAYIENGSDWSYIGTLDVGVLYSHEGHNGATYRFKYSDGTTVATWTGWCGETYVVDDQCNNACEIVFTNNACYKILIYAENGTDWTYVAPMNVGDSYTHATVNGTTYRFKYIDGTVVSTLTGWCGESFNITDDCNTSCNIYLTNDACAPVRVYVEIGTDWNYIGILNQGSSYTHDSANGTTYRFKYTDGTVVSTWTGWCGETFTITDDCATSCDIDLINDACGPVRIYVENGSDWNYIGTVDQGETYTHDTSNGTTYRFKYTDGSVVSTWTGWCGESFTISDECQTSCSIYFKNVACEKIHAFIENETDWTYIGALEVGVQYSHEGYNGAVYRFKYADGSVVATWTAWCDESFNISDDCAQSCEVHLKNRTCGRVRVLKDDGGTLVSIGYLAVGEKITVDVYEGTSFIFKNDAGEIVDNWSAVCGHLFTAREECPTECYGYIKNEACADLKVFKVRAGYNLELMGSIAVGSTLQLHADEGTEYIIKSTAEATVAEWSLVCDGTFTVSEECADPCDGVNVLHLKIYDQETDEAVEGIGSLVNGMTIDADLLPEGYYLTAEVSDATESVSLIVNDWLVCENFAPYTFPNAAHQGTNWEGGVGAHSVTLKTSSEADCKDPYCDQVTISFTIEESDEMPEDTCQLTINVSQSEPTCEGIVSLSVVESDASECCEDGDQGACASLQEFGGYILDEDAVSGCVDGEGIRLWAAGSDEVTFVTVDFGRAILAGNEVCFTMLLKHCLNTYTTSSSASVYTSLNAEFGFEHYRDIEFSNSEFQDFCYELTTDTRYVKIVDNGNCSFRIDAVSITGGNDCVDANEVSYYWLNSTGDTISTESTVDVTETGDYIVAVKDCAGCLVVLEDIIVDHLDAGDCNTNPGGAFTDGTDKVGTRSDKSITSQDKSSSLLVYPNPAVDFVQINYETKGLESVDIDVQFYTIDGKMVNQSTIQSNQNQQIDISTLQSHQFYIVRLQHPELGLETTRIYKSE